MPYVRKAEIESAPMLEESLLYHPSRTNFCVLNGTAARIWERLERPADLDELVAALADSYDLPERTEVVEADVRKAVDQLLELDLITAAP